MRFNSKAATSAKAPPKLCPVAMRVAVGCLLRMAWTLLVTCDATPRQSAQNPLCIQQRRQWMQGTFQKLKFSIQFWMFEDPRKERMMAFLLAEQPMYPGACVRLKTTQLTSVSTSEPALLQFHLSMQGLSQYASDANTTISLDLCTSQGFSCAVLTKLQALTVNSSIKTRVISLYMVDLIDYSLQIKPNRVLNSGSLLIHLGEDLLDVLLLFGLLPPEGFVDEVRDEEEGSCEEEGSSFIVYAEDFLVEKFEDFFLPGPHYQLWLQFSALLAHSMDGSICADWLIMMDHSLFILRILVILGQVERQYLIVICWRHDIHQLISRSSQLKPIFEGVIPNPILLATPSDIRLRDDLFLGE